MVSPGSRLGCERCNDETDGLLNRLKARVSRVVILEGPNGKRLCGAHHMKALKEYYNE